MPAKILNAPETARCYQDFTGYRPSIPTIYRWWQVGVAGIRMEQTILPHRRGSTKKQVAEFLKAVEASDPAAFVEALGRRPNRHRSVSRNTALSREGPS